MNDSNIRGDTRTQQHGKLKRKSGMNGGGGGLREAENERSKKSSNAKVENERTSRSHAHLMLCQKQSKAHYTMNVPVFIVACQLYIALSAHSYRRCYVSYICNSYYYYFCNSSIFWQLFCLFLFVCWVC